MDKVLTIDVGGTFIKYGLIDDKCQLTHTSKLKTPYESQDYFIDVLYSIYEELKGNGLQGIAISAPGLIDVQNGIMRTSGMLTYLEGIHLSERLSERCNHLPVSVENDGKAAALCESWVGSAKDGQSCVVLIFGSGIGGGVVLNKQVVRGNDLIAGEFSPIFIDMKKDSYNNFAGEYSTLSIVRKVQEIKSDESIDGERVMQLYRQEDEKVCHLLNEWFEAIAKFCFNIDNMLNPDCICIGGGISADPLFIQKIQESIDVVSEKAFVFRKPLVKVCQYFNDSNLIGAYYTYKQMFGGK